MKRSILGMLLLTLASGALAGGSMDIALTNTSLRFEHDATRVGTGAHITFGALYSDGEGYLASAGFNAVDASGGRADMVGGLGFKGFFFDPENQGSGVSIAVGGFVRYYPDSFNGLGVEGILYFSPDVLTFNDASSFHEMVARVTYKVMPQARVFIGFQDVGADYSGTNTVIDRGFNLGFRVNY